MTRATLRDLRLQLDEQDREVARLRAAAPDCDVVARISDEIDDQLQRAVAALAFNVKPAAPRGMRV